ncbi:conserved hypothetical protein [Beggiatoa sp. PS]|nr:conserved hypothetical protein [Beggiatoa sp. PS]
MPYNKFTIQQIRKQFDVKVLEEQTLFTQITPVQPSEMLGYFLKRHIPLAEAIGTEKAKSEFIIAPILSELRELTEHRISLFSGIEFNVDEEHGLNGRCDYIISQSSLQFCLTTPVLMMVEAKNDNINSGLGQCMAEMLAAQMFNQQEGHQIETIYGCVTTGSLWKFLQLQDKKISIDNKQYFIESLDILLGILVHLIAQ